MNSESPDDLSREIYCILGIPIDAVDMRSVLRRIEVAAASKTPFVVSTPNLNFLVLSQSDPEFRESLLLSDLCPADGAPIVWLAWLFGIPIRGRIAGSDIFEALKVEYSSASPLKIFLFGGAEGVAAKASGVLNVQPRGMYCVGSLDPGFGSVDELSRSDFIDDINSSQADFLVASLGAHKGQLWLLRNHQRFRIPVRAHFGAAINFQAGTVNRSPKVLRKVGFEWLWRIKEEPYLWRRYFNDGSVFLRLLVTRVPLLAFWSLWVLLKYELNECELNVTQAHSDKSVTLYLSGPATARQVEKAIPAFRDVIAAGKEIIVDFSKTYAIDARFLGLLLMLRKELKKNGASLACTRLSRGMIRIFRLYGLEFLLPSVEDI
jgi:N-acetylglucosaminyldiphosphoundecaprenol N-acetyl-beta-D-mannosaminyltransferase